MTTYYWYKTCPRCAQDRLLMQWNRDAESLYLHCGECEGGWHHPDEVADASKGFLTLFEDFVSENPSLEQIARGGWKPFVSGSFVA
jgi:hypothetical protein